MNWLKTWTLGIKNKIVQIRFGLLGGVILFGAILIVMMVGLFGQVWIASTGLVGEGIVLGSFNSPASSAPAVIQKSLTLVNKGEIPPQISAVGVWVEDLETNSLLYQKNSNQRLLPASTTKMMTALVGVDYYKFDDDLVVNEQSLVSGSSMNLSIGERLSFRALLYGMLLNSGNDAAYTIASNYPGGVNGFINAMNEKAKNLGLVNTNFSNPAGFDTDNHFSSVNDLAKIAKAVIANESLSRIVATKETVVVSENQPKTHSLSNLNQLLGEEGVIGIKTGYTEKSGENLVTLVDRDGRKVLLIVLDSDDRFGETKKLLKWAYDNFSLEWH